MSRAEVIKAKRPELIGTLEFYQADEDGPAQRKYIGWGCTAFTQRNALDPPGYDCWPQFAEFGMAAGEEGELGFVFLSGAKAAQQFVSAGQMYLWEGRFIGEVKKLRLAK